MKYRGDFERHRAEGWWQECGRVCPKAWVLVAGLAVLVWVAWSVASAAPRGWAAAGRLPAATTRVARWSDVLAHDASYKLRVKAAMLLGNSGEPAAVEPLVAALAGASERVVRAAAAAALGVLHQPRAVVALVQAAATDNEALVRHQAQGALQRFPIDGVLPAAVAAFGSSDARVRRAALLLLLTVGGGVLTSPVVFTHALGDVPAVAAVAKASLERLPADQAAAFLEQALRHSHTDVRRGAVEALRRLASPRAVPLLIKVCQRDVEAAEVRLLAQQILLVRAPSLPQQATALLARRDAPSQDRLAALQMLGALGRADAAPRLRQALFDEDVEVRGMAVVTLDAMADCAALPMLERMAADPHNQKIVHLLQRTVRHLHDKQLGESAACPALLGPSLTEDL